MKSILYTVCALLLAFGSLQAMEDNRIRLVSSFSEKRAFAFVDTLKAGEKTRKKAAIASQWLQELRLPMGPTGYGRLCAGQVDLM